jgi:CheY-like chemotaxis protein
MPNGGALTLTTADIELDPHSLGRNGDVQAGRYVAICITDDGVGMSKETLDRAFEPFFTTKEVGKGSGLGLSMVYGFVKQSNGHVTIYSEPGLGTTVRIYLPFAMTDAERAQSHLSDADLAPHGDETILVVEDDAFVRRHAIATLESLGYRVMVAPDGRAALRFLRRGARPDLLFTDIVMPGGVTGWELAAQAREIAPQLRVLFTSGYPLEALANRGQIDPGAIIVAKPYRKAELARRVREAIAAGTE